MPTAGARLRQAREQAGLTLHDVAEQTKIQRWILTAIEEGDLSRVPGGVFIRGYVTSYARAVGLDDERLWAEYRAETDTRVVETEAVEAPPEVRSSRPVWTIVAIAAAVVVTAVLWRNMSRSNPDTTNVALPRPAQRASEVVPAAATSGPRPEAVVVVASTRGDGATLPSAPLVIKLNASSDVWVEAKADGEQRIYRLVTAGEDLTVDARREIVLRIGDASAVTYTINGAPGRSAWWPGHRPRDRRVSGQLSVAAGVGDRVASSDEHPHRRGNQQQAADARAVRTERAELLEGDKHGQRRNDREVHHAARQTAAASAPSSIRGSTRHGRRPCERRRRHRRASGASGNSRATGTSEGRRA